MKVLLIKDVYKLGHAGDVKRVADGFGRNYLLPQGLAVLATPGALKQSEKIRNEATKQRAIINNEMAAIADMIKNVTLAFAAKAGETGKMYGSITTQDIASALKEKSGVDVKRHQIDMQPLRALGEHKVYVRLTMDLVPEIKVLVYREGEANPLEPTVSAKKVSATAAVESAPVDETPAPAEVEVATESSAPVETTDENETSAENLPTEQSSNEA